MIKKSKLIRFISLLLALTMAVPSMLSVSASAEDSLIDNYGGIGLQMTDTYILSVCTGAAAGDAVEYFGIRYTDGSGVSRTEFVFPHEGYAKQTYDYVEDYARDKTRISAVSSYVDYKPSTDYGIEGGLKANSTEMYMITMRYGFKVIEYIDVYMKNNSANKGSNDWTCSDIRFYQCDRFYGMATTGYYSSDYYIEFTGELLAKFTPLQKNGGDFSVDKNNKIFRIEPDGEKYYKLDTDIDPDLQSYTSRRTCDQYVFRMDIADNYGSGIESLANEPSDNKASLNTMGLCEALAVTVTYKDIYGVTRKTVLPFITSAAAYARAEDSIIGNSAFIGIAQQGDTLAFTGVLPDCQEITGFLLYYGSYAADVCGLVSLRSSSVTARMEARASAIGTGSDVLDYCGFSIMPAASSAITYTKDNAILRCSTSGNPLYYYVSSSSSGQRITPETKREIFSSFTKSDPDTDGAVTLIPLPDSASYVFQIETDSIDIAATAADITIELTYMDTTGREKASNEMDLRTITRSYYGYWPGGADAAYYAGMSAGGTIVFSVPYSDVDYFSSIKLTIDTEPNDDWQFTSITIYKVSSLSSRQAKWYAGTKNVNGAKINCEIWRDFPTDYPVQRYSKKTLLNTDNDNVVIKFDGSGGSDEYEEDVDWENLKKRMTYEETLSNLGFVDGTMRYQVKVLVASNSDSSSDIYGDCGSTNSFYFKLVFENGSSGYVLANQQMTSDGFRAGKTESFYIITNRSYGDLKAVRIIPDDTQEESDIYDKLNIENIEIIQSSDGDVCRSWKVDSVGWIDIDYIDSDASATLEGQRLRAEMELASSMAISSSGYSMKFMVALATGDYPDGLPQFTGSLGMSVEYKTTSGIYKTADFDAIEQMSVYAGKTVSTGAIPTKNSGTAYKKSDSGYMLREGHVDRFYFLLTDVTSISSITFYAYSDYETKWNISSVYIYRVVEDGLPYINASSEYQRNAQVSFLCKDTSTDGITTFLTANSGSSSSAQEIPIDLTKNSFEVSSDLWESIVERVPTTDTDAVNIYYYLTSGSTLKSTSNIAGSIRYYVGENDTLYQTKIPNFNVDTVNNIVYAKGLSVKGMTTFKSLVVRMDAKIDHAIVQHTREGVVIGTYYVPFYDESAADTLTGTSFKRKDARSERQVVELQIGDLENSIPLTTDEKDVAISIKYTTDGDPTGTVLSSENIFLTDQDINTIKSGDILTLEFSESYVGTVTRVAVVAIGNVSAEIESAAVYCYKTDNSGVESLTGYYGITEPITISRATASMPCSSEEAISHLTLDITTDKTKAYLGMEENVISMKINYTDVMGLVRTLDIQDIGKYISKGSIKGGQTARIELLIPDVKTLNYAILEPHGTDNTTKASWPVTTAVVTCLINGKESSLTRELNTEIMEGTGATVNFRIVKAELTAKVRDASGEFVITRTTTAQDAEINVYENYTLELSAAAVNAIEGTTCTLEFETVSGKDGYAITKVLDTYYLKMNAETTVRVTATATDGQSVSKSSFLVKSGKSTTPIVIPENTEE